MAHGPFVEHAPAKVNLSLHVLGRRPDGYHELESLVAFAALGDRLSLAPGPELELSASGPTAHAAGPAADNLVLKAARLLAQRVENLTLGRFSLSKELPVAAGIGGGSADAAAALRLLARVNGLSTSDPRIVEAARETGADVPVCLDPRPRLMRGKGEVLSAPINLPALPAVLVNPGVALPTRDVFAALALPIQERSLEADESSLERDFQQLPTIEAVAALLRRYRNDLEAPAAKLQPVIGDVLQRLRSTPGCLLARMSGSGATCFALYETRQAASAAHMAIAAAEPRWWVRATTFG